MGLGLGVGWVGDGVERGDLVDQSLRLRRDEEKGTKEEEETDGHLVRVKVRVRVEIRLRVRG